MCKKHLLGILCFFLLHVNLYAVVDTFALADFGMEGYIGGRIGEGLVVDEDGKVWIINEHAAQLVCYDPMSETHTLYPTPKHDTVNVSGANLHMAPNGNIYISSTGNEVYLFFKDTKEWDVLTPPEDISIKDTDKILVDQQGKLWVLRKYQYLVSYDGTWQQHTPHDTMGAVVDMAVDAEGTVWCSSMARMIKLEGSEWSAFDTVGRGFITLGYDNDLWYRIEAEFITHRKGEVMTNYAGANSDNMLENVLFCRADQRKEKMYFAVEASTGAGKTGLVMYDGETFSYCPGSEDFHYPITLCPGINNDIWVSANGPTKIYHYRNPDMAILGDKSVDTQKDLFSAVALQNNTMRLSLGNQEYKNVYMTLYTMQGRAVKAFDYTVLKNGNLTFSTAGLSHGAYICTVKTDGFHKTGIITVR